MGSRGTSRGQVQVILGTKWWRREGRSPDNTVVVGNIGVRIDRIGWDHVGIVWWRRPSLRAGRRVEGVPGKNVICDSRRQGCHLWKLCRFIGEAASLCRSGE